MYMRSIEVPKVRNFFDDASVYDFIVFIMRGQPMHVGHQEVIEHALTLGKRVIILLGSAFQPRTIKNPWKWEERAKMIKSVFSMSNVVVYPLCDFKSDNNVWAANVQRIVDDDLRKNAIWTDYPAKGRIIGHDKDESSFYLKLFPQWGDPINHPLNEEVHATDIRRIYFEDNIRYLKDVVPVSVFDYLFDFKKTSEYALLKEEWEFIKNYKRSWAGAPYEPIFQTADAVVVQSGNVLLVQRRATPGKGLWALPGGFVNPNERIDAAAYRELREETKIDVPEKVLRGCQVKWDKFDDPSRSLRGRTITHAYYIVLPAGPLPKVKGSDDAVKAKWIPLSEVNEEEMFEDHYSIIQSFVGKFN